MEKLNVAIVGATGAVGEAMREILDERQFPAGDVRLLASERSVGKRFTVAGKSRTVELLDDFDFADTQVALFSAGGSISGEHAPRAADAGAVVIDNTSKFRQEEGIPLVVPEVNGHRIADGLGPNIIANPNCSTIQMVVALAPIYDAVGIERINVATYQAVSGAGQSGVEELASQTVALLNAKALPDPAVHPVQIAFNAVPQAWDFLDNGYSVEEMKMVRETCKIFEDDNIRVNPTCVRVPVFYGHSEAVHIETRDPIAAADARDLLRMAPGVVVIDDAEGGCPTAVDHGAGEDAVYVGRIREDLSHPHGLNLWIVSDNVRKGAALNSIQIAEGVRDLIG
jgi:aspartate-semialdehyde dehydrogenase